jgi:plasmid stability protein
MISMLSLLSMATLLIRNLPDVTKEALRNRAAKNGRSMEEEARKILFSELSHEIREEVGLGTWLVNLAKEVGGGYELEIPPRTGKMRKPPFLTDEEWGE